MSRDDLPPSIDFAEEEEKIIKFHNEINAFKTSNDLSRKRPPYTFYDGPPFATGLPHYGHILAGTIKDVMTRFAYSEGYHVERHFGWDCHGLPVEYEVDKVNGITGPADVAVMGVAAYNDKCREIVMRYSSQWRDVVQRIGRWIDFDDDYRTMYPTFMESVWWVFKQLFEKGLVYRGVKVMPFSTACATPLSNFEAGQNYRDVQDPAIVVSFPVIDNDKYKGVELLAWTTTPWTLPSNLALCVHPEKDYVQVKDKTRDKRVFVLMECRLPWLFKKPEDYEVLGKMKGQELVGLEYKPLFDYFVEIGKAHGAFRVLCDTYVTEETGTGVVHQAPYFGEDDFRICLREGIVTKEMAPVCPVDESGRFMTEVRDFAGQYVKEADREICKHIKQANRLIHQSTIQHSYPFCWRSDTPLLYKAVSTWFVRVEDLVERLLANNAATYWVPDFIKEKRFANWLRDARDWAISRNRYWGTPIPLWVSDDLEEVVCVGSIEELQRLSGVKLTDLHKEFVDPITIPSQRGKGVLRRIPEVFDCWFESGSMPYAQLHYPFENVERFRSGFPADFIAEGVDQTRGWFYTLLVLSTALFDKPPFKNVIVSGIVLAADGQKMSKRMKNYPDPCAVINQYGADALRLYLVNSPVVCAQNLRFLESGVRDVLKDVMIPWYNVFRFLVKSGLEVWDRANAPQVFRVDLKDWPKSTNPMDRWVLSYTQTLLSFVQGELRAYRLQAVLPRLLRFVDLLVNWHVRLNRRRLRGETVAAAASRTAGQTDWFLALHTLTKVMLQLVHVMAPLAPFFTEYLYQRLKPRINFSDLKLDGASQVPGCLDSNGAPQSVHYLVKCLGPAPPESGVVDTSLERRVAYMQAAVETGRSIRTRRDLPLKAPLRSAVVVLPASATGAEAMAALSESGAEGLGRYVREELNVRELRVTQDKAAYGVRLRARLNPATVGPRLKDRFKALSTALAALPQEKLEEYLVNREMVLEGATLSGEDVTIDYLVGASTSCNDTDAGNKGTKSKGKGGKAKKPAEKAEADEEGPQYEAAADTSNCGLLVLLDVRPDADLEAERLARELINRIQRTRKKGNLVPEDTIQVVVATDSEELQKIAVSHAELIDATVKQPIVCCPARTGDATAAAKVAVEARGECLGDFVVSDETSIPPDDLVVSLFHRIVPGTQGQNCPDGGDKSLSVRCAKSGECLKVRLLYPSGKPIFSSAVDLLNAVRAASGWVESSRRRLFQSTGEEITPNWTGEILALASQELLFE